MVAKANLVLASPAAAVKMGRERGPSVQERWRKEEEAAAARTCIRKPEKARSAAHAVVLADALQLPNGVGIQGRGRAAMNGQLSESTNCVAAMQERQQSLLAAAEFRSARAVVAVTAAGAGNFDAMPDRDDYIRQPQKR